MKTPNCPSARILAAFAAIAATVAALSGCHSPSGSCPPPSGGGIARLADTPPDPVALLAAALDPARLAAVDTARFPDADSAAVFQWESTKYAENGTYVTEWVSVDKILTERGLEDAASFSFWNNDFYGSITVLVARVRSPDGSVRDIDLGANLAEAVDTSSLSSNIHDPNDKNWTLAFPGLEVGDTVEVRLRRTVSKPRCEGVYADYLLFEQDSPILFQGVRIEGPVSKPLLSRAFRDAGPVSLAYFCRTNSAAGTVEETWTASDVPRYFAEPDMPPAHTCTARLLLSTAPDWQSISRWYARLCEPHLAATNAAMARLVAERTAGAASRDATIRALFDFVSREVRYMGAMAESEAPGYEPHDVSLTFDNRYGVCRDKAALLVTLLRMAGIQTWPVLVNAGPRKDPDVPQPYFNHAIAAADSGNPDAPYILMDPTSETTRALLPEYLCEKSYLVARDDGDVVRETPPLPVADNLCDASTSVRFLDDGAAQCDTRIRFTGINDAAYRNHFASIPRDSIRAFCQRLLARATAGAVLTSWSLAPDPADLRSDLSPLELRISFEMPAALVPLSSNPPSGDPSSTSVPFDPPRFAESLAVASHLVGDLGLETRRFPLETQFPCGFRDSISFSRAPEKRPPVRFSEGGVDWDEVLDGTNLVRSMSLRKSVFSPADYPALRMAVEASEKAGRAPLFLPFQRDCGQTGPTAAHSLSDALSRSVRPVPEDDFCRELSRRSIDLSDWPRSWSVTTETRTKILTYAGRRRFSDATFVWQPAVETLEILDARTVSADGVESPVNPALDIFVGDQSWVADAPRYPAGKITTVSFPKVEPGATVCCTVRRTTRVADFFSFRHRFGSLDSFREDTVEAIGGPEARRLFSLRAPRDPDLLPFRAPAGVETPQMSVWTLRGGGTGTAVAKESGMPSDGALFHVLEATSVDSVARASAIRAAFLERSDPAVQTNAAALARSLVAADATPEAIVRAIRDWTDLNLRAAGPDWTSLPLSMLSGADETLAARYGHDADRQILRLAMARALGLEPEFVFGAAAWNDPGEPDPLSIPPSPSTIGTVVFAFPGSGGTRLVLSDSSRFAPLGYDPLADCAALTLPAAGRESFRRPESPPLFQRGDEAVSATETRLDCSVRPDGSAAVSVCIRHRGVSATAFRQKYSQILPEERRRDAQSRVAALWQSARATTPVEAICPPEGPCELRFSAEVPDFAAVLGDGRLSFRVSREVLSPETAPRTFPFARSGAVRSLTETRIRVPEGWGVELAPEAAGDWIDPRFGVSLQRRVEFDPEEGVALLVSDTLCLGPAEFGPEKYPEFLARELDTRGPARNTVVLRAR